MKWIRLPTLLCIVLAAAAAYGQRSAPRTGSITIAATNQINRTYGPTLAQPAATQPEESPSDVQPQEAPPPEEVPGHGHGGQYHASCCEPKPYFAASLWAGYCAEKKHRVPHMGGKHCRSCGQVACGGKCGGGWSSWRTAADCGCHEPVANCCPPLFDFHWLHGHLHLRGKHCCECQGGGEAIEETPELPTPEPPSVEGAGAETSAMYHGGRYDDGPILDSGPLVRLHRRLFGWGSYANDGAYDGQIVIEDMSDAQTEVAQPQPSVEWQPQSVGLDRRTTDEQRPTSSLRRQLDREPTTETMIHEAPEGSLLDRLFGPTRRFDGPSLGP